jgi:SNF2 family DNA or RNA helicase
VKLFNFQAEAVDKLKGVKAVLIGDDMGLGKTFEAIALDLERRSHFPEYKLKTLIICPLAMVSTWTRTWFQCAPELNILPINNKDRSHFVDELSQDNYDVFIMHWPALRLIEELEEVKWFHVIADEAHALQNRNSKQSKALKRIPAGYKSALTGTPAFDKPDDLWSILNWLYPRYWSSYWQYYNDHILFENFNGYKTVIGVNNPQKLQDEMSAFYVRRLKQDVLLDLPEKYYSERRVDLHPQQARAYKTMKEDMLAWIGEREAEPVVAPVVIAQLTRLQQFACAFAEFDEVRDKMILSEPSSKLDAVMEIIESTDQQIVVFSQFAQVIKLLAARLEKKGITHGKFIGETPADERARIISGFQEGKIQVFAGTISAGGVGITLTASSTVVFIDRSWSAALNLQAEDRLHRIGQKQAVQVIDIIANDTIDRKRIKIIKTKWEWVRRLIGDTKVDPKAEDFDDADDDDTED